MAHYKDLSLCEYLPESQGLGFVAVGWLDPSQEYPKGEVSPEFFKRFCMLLVNHWEGPIVSMGNHPCPFCRFTGGRSIGDYCGYKIGGVGRSQLYVPYGETLFVSPSNIAHYVDAHDYCPPSEFQAAVLQCPEMRSLSYMKALLATPAKEWLTRVESSL